MPNRHVYSSSRLLPSSSVSSSRLPSSGVSSRLCRSSTVSSVSNSSRLGGGFGSIAGRGQDAARGSQRQPVDDAARDGHERVAAAHPAPPRQLLLRLLLLRLLLRLLRLRRCYCCCRR